MGTVLLLLLTLLPAESSRPLEPVYEVDLIHINHYFFYQNGETKILVDQIIFYKFKETIISRKGDVIEKGWGYEIIDWRLIPSARARTKLPKKEYDKLKEEHYKRWKARDTGEAFSPPFNPPFIGAGFIPIKTKEGKYVSIFYSNKKIYKVVGNQYRETWTQYDPEIAERKIIDKSKRIGLEAVKVYR